MDRIQLFDGMVFGRDNSCDIIVDDESVSGSHFKILIIDYEVHVIDLESSNSTFLNDVAIIPNKQVKLHAKDVLRIGEQEYSYSSGAIRKLDLPSLSHTLQVDRLKFDEMPSPDIERIETASSYDEDLSFENVEILQPKKPETGLKALRSAKKYLDELHSVNNEILEKVEQLKQMRRRKIEVGAKVDTTKKILSECEFKNEKDFEKELRLHRGTVEGYKMKIKKEEKEIARIKKIIDKAEEDIAQAKFNIAGYQGESKHFFDKFDAVNEKYDIYKNKNVFENEFSTLKDTIRKYEALDLDGKKDEVEKEIKLKAKQYKEMQDHYGAKLNSDMIKKKAASE